jgi:hypothetical protein
MVGAPGMTPTGSPDRKTIVRPVIGTRAVPSAISVDVSRFLRFETRSSPSRKPSSEASRISSGAAVTFPDDCARWTISFGSKAYQKYPADLSTTTYDGSAARICWTTSSAASCEFTTSRFVSAAAGTGVSVSRSAVRSDPPRNPILSTSSRSSSHRLSDFMSSGWVK